MEESSGVRKRRIESQPNEDRISALPDSVIHHILSFLPSTEQAIRTGILSKRWRNLWTHVPVLIFRAPTGSGDNYLRFIENTLDLHKCPKIRKFHIEYVYDAAVDPQFDRKISFAVSKCVEELMLRCYHIRGSYSLPMCLFDNASLVRLEIYNCDINPSWRVNFPSLKSLKTDYKFSQGNDNIVSGSPLLESLEIIGADVGPFSIVSKSLKVLSFVDVEFDNFIKISCPNLVELNVVSEEEAEVRFPDQMIEKVLSGSPLIHSLKLVDGYGFSELVIASESLKELHLEYVKCDLIELSCPNLEKFDLFNFSGDFFLSFKLPYSIRATLDILPWTWKTRQWARGDFVKQLIRQFQNVKEITLKPLLFKILSKFDVETRRSLPLLHCKCLTLDIDTPFSLALPGIAYAFHLQLLETLVLNLKFMVYQDKVDEDTQDYRNSDWSTGFTCLVSQYLTTVKIVGLCEKEDRCKLVLEFIEYLLKNARGLKKMTVVLEKPGTGFLVEFSQKLLSFPKYSRRASVEVLCSA